MDKISNVDIRIANFFRRFFSYYIRKRENHQSLKKNKLWMDHFKRSDFFTHNLTEDLKINLYSDSLLCQLIYFGFEQTEISFINRFLRKGDVFLDIGSNIGLYSLVAAKIIGYEGKIYAFEPTPSTYKRLLENISLNNFSNINAYNIGLSNKESTLDFYTQNDGHDAWNSFVRLTQFTNENNAIQVKVETLDSLIQEYKIENISLIKIDVEGWEKYVLEGCIKLLEKENSPVFLIEFTETNAFDAGYYIGEIFDFMQKYGYEWYSYNAELNSLNKEEKKLHYPYENLIAIKNLDSCLSRINNIA